MKKTAFLSLTFVLTGLTNFSFGETGQLFGGWLEARPTYEAVVSEFRTENEVGLSAQIHPALLLSYVQEFQTLEESGFHLGDGYLKTEANLLSSKALLLNHESRWYVPTHRENREAGFLIALRNDFKFSTPLFNTVRLALWEIPILYAYSQPEIREGEETAPSPVFENQVQLMFQVALFKDQLNIKTPLVHQWTRDRVEWAHSLKWNPEATYSIFEKTQLGAAYSTANLLNGENSYSLFQVILNQAI